MTPGAIVTLIKDVVILVAVGLLIWLLISYGKDIVKVSDMQGVQKQLQANTQIISRWAEEAHNADTQRAKDLAKVQDTITTQRAPIIVMRQPAGPRTLSCPAVTPPSSPTGTGGTGISAREDPLPVVDVRQAINGYEQRIEQTIADCRAALAAWPTNP